MKTKKQIVCIVCPKGCKIDVAMEDDKIVSIEGFSCKRGETYATAECTAPTRMLTTTMRVSGGRLPLLPVRSRKPIPKGLLFDFIKKINTIQVEAPVAVGDVVLKNLLGTGIDIIASRSMPRAS
jgi:CxxC motif-containing protein